MKKILLLFVFGMVVCCHIQADPVADGLGDLAGAVKELMGKVSAMPSPEEPEETTPGETGGEEQEEKATKAGFLEIELTPDSVEKLKNELNQFFGLKKEEGVDIPLWVQIKFKSSEDLAKAQNTIRAALKGGKDLQVFFRNARFTEKIKNEKKRITWWAEIDIWAPKGLTAHWLEKAGGQKEVPVGFLWVPEGKDITASQLEAKWKVMEERAGTKGYLVATAQEIKAVHYVNDEPKGRDSVDGFLIAL